jgi:hypothetical protein
VSVPRRALRARGRPRRGSAGRRDTQGRGYPVSERPTPADRLLNPDAVLTRSALAELGLERRAVDAVFSACPAVVLPAYSRPTIRVSDYRELIDASSIAAIARGRHELAERDHRPPERGRENGSRVAALLRTLAGSGRNVQSTAAPVHSLRAATLPRSSPGQSWLPGGMAMQASVARGTRATRAS